LRSLIFEIRDRLLSTADTVCLQRARLVTEAYARYGSDAVPILRAKALAHVLQHMDLDVTSNPIFAGNTSSRPRAWMLVPEHGFCADAQVLIENDGLDGLLDDAIPADLRSFWEGRSAGGSAGIGHLAVDLEQAVHVGLEALIAETRRYPDDPDLERRAYREAMGIALQAVIDWAHRYADAAQEAAQVEARPEVRAAHVRVARACRHVPARPARNLFEGLQAIALVHLALAIEGHGMSVSIGLPDRVLARFVDASFNREAATELVAAFTLKIAANSFLGRGSKTQAITIGGADHHGRDRCNLLTGCFLEACDQLRIGDPHLFLRWHAEMDGAVAGRAYEMLARGASMPLLIHDAPTAGGFASAGVAPEDAWSYCVIGCNELGIPGRLADSATAAYGTVQYLALLNETLLEGADVERITSMPKLLSALEATMARHAFGARQRGMRRVQRAAAQVPTPFTSALMRGCIARGVDMRTGMDYHLPGIYERGLANAANALAAIEETVFERGTLSLRELVEALRADLADECVREQLLDAPKWGNDDPRADHWALALVEMRERVLACVDAQFGHSPHVVCHVVRSLHRLDGHRISASADGRYGGTPVGDSIGAVTGTARRGPTAILDSVLKLDAARYYRGGYNLNLTLDRTSTTPEVVGTLVEAFFGEGGQELQVSCYDAGLLREAQREPVGHGDLVVRVAGFNARFVDLSREEQDELIERAELVARG
jgi:pyruvate-formate lyase